MAFRLRLVPTHTNFPFMKMRNVVFALSILSVIGAIVLYFNTSLNYGIDFEGGISIEARTKGKADISAIRETVNDLGLGEAAIQEFGDPRDVLIRLERQPGGDAGQKTAVVKTQAALDKAFPGISYRQVSFVGPRVSEELKVDALWSITLSTLAVLLYIWFRFEWQYGVGAILALIHDVALTIGLFSITGMDFSLSAVAAVLTIMGYSLNDTVVVYDRIRETLPKFKQMPIPELLDRAINDTLSRTTTTSMITFIALLAMLVLGPEVIKVFTIAMLWGVVVGTYSSIFIAAPCLIFFNLKRDDGKKAVADAEAAARP